MLTIAYSLVASAQTATLSVVGRVLTSNRHPASATRVRVWQEHREIAKVQTDRDGFYYFNLASGTYTLEVGSVSRTLLLTSDKLSVPDIEIPSQNETPAFFDEPKYTVSGVTDNTYRGGHGSDTILRSSEALAKATSDLGKSSSDISEPMHDRAEVDERAGRSLQAVKEFQKAAELNPSERNLFDWGTELLSHRAPKAASEVFGDAHRRFPGSTRLLLGLATSRYALGDFAQSGQCFFEAIDLNPDDPSPLAFLHEAQSQEIIESTGYLERFARFAESHPQDATANYYYGSAIWEQHQHSEDKNFAEKVTLLLQKSVSLDPHLAAAYLLLGTIYLNQGRYAAAIKNLKTASQEGADLAEAHYKLSEAYRLNGQPNLAQDELATYKTLSSEKNQKIELERRHLQQFVIALKKTPH